MGAHLVAELQHLLAALFNNVQVSFQHPALVLEKFFKLHSTWLPTGPAHGAKPQTPRGRQTTKPFPPDLPLFALVPLPLPPSSRPSRACTGARAREVREVRHVLAKILILSQVGAKRYSEALAQQIVSVTRRVPPALWQFSEHPPVPPI